MENTDRFWEMLKISDDIWKIPTDVGHVSFLTTYGRYRQTLDMLRFLRGKKIWKRPTDFGHDKLPNNIIIEDSD